LTNDAAGLPPSPVRARSLFLSHGGGPLPLMGDPGHEKMVACLRRIADRIERPDAIVVASAQREEPVVAVSHAAHPQLYYDYGGFPEETYHLSYPALGAPDLAERIAGALHAKGLQARLDDVRGLDHGTFVPLMLMYPQADVPIVQVSLLDSLDPDQHIRFGKALSGLCGGGTLLIGSGFSFHNMRAFGQPDTAETRALNERFEAWLAQTCSDGDLDEAARHDRLVAWADAPGARFCHPREEHLLPLHVCYGAAGGPCSQVFSLSILGKRSSMYLWSERDRNG